MSGGMHIFVLREFQKWLSEEKPLPDGAKFFSQRPDQCPLAWFLIVVHRYRVPEIKGKTAFWYQGHVFTERSLPKWARVYASLVDTRYIPGEPMTLEQAREALQETIIAMKVPERLN